jgi:hypothetical protein
MIYPKSYGSAHIYWACLANNRIEQSSGLLVLKLVKSNDVI